MKNSLCFLFVLLFCSAHAGGRLKVACVGNSITYGAGVAERDHNSYPAQLQAWLGPNYEVRNFGINARTLLHRGDLPYVESDTYRESLAYHPDVVLIKLGTNDTKPQNRIYLESDYKKNYAELIDSYRALPSHPRVILLTPVRCYLDEGQFSTQCYLQIIIPTIGELACEKGCELIDLYSVFEPKWAEHLMPDKLHPSSIGAGMLAAKIGPVVAREGCASRVGSAFSEAETFNFHGYAGYSFEMAGALCRIVEPKRADAKMPWVWRARFWGHEPQTDIALLERGFHVVYCDVADLYGSPRAVKRWDEFYERMIGLGLNRRVALEGMSRGGLIVYTWAMKNPEKVACIYADAPVMDFKSWPMGLGAGCGSAEDVPRLMAAYGFRDEAEAVRWRHNPLDGAERLARAGIPMLHVVGDADPVVPVAENTDLFEKAVLAHGGNIRVIHKYGVGHHPHSLPNPAPIVEFILANCGYPQDKCLHAVPGNEYRSGAGWRAGAQWHAVAEEIDSLLRVEKLDVLFLGNSITQGLGGNRSLVTSKPGREAADDAFAGLRWESAGISGDRTQHLLWRLRNGTYGASSPKVAVVAIGINNLIAGDDPALVAEGVAAVAHEAAKVLPGARILVLGPLPAGSEPDDPLRERFEEVQRRIARVSFGEGIDYVDPSVWFVGADGRLRDGLYGQDGIHLTQAGYRVWCEQMRRLSAFNRL